MLYFSQRVKKRGERSKIKFLVGAGLAAGLATALAVMYLRINSVAVLNPAGPIADRERDLIITSTILMLVIVLPVFVMTFAIAWRYRAGNKAAYRPDWDGSRGIELLWWALPLVIIGVLSVIAWRSSHELDPFKPLDNTGRQPLKIQVIALQWKWLFIYPDIGIATVNHIEFPTENPIEFNITSDAPMNSFWIPRLGGQIYAMPGMHTKLHLQADRGGVFRGSSANISGSGFAKMNFTAKATDSASFVKWVESVRLSGAELNSVNYEALARPSSDGSVAFFANTEKNLFNKILAKYLAPAHTHSQIEGDRH